MPKEFENAGSALKIHQMFAVHTTPEKFKKATVSGRVGFVFENHVIIVTSWFSKAPFSKCFPSTRKLNTGVFKFFRFEERFRKASFS